MSVWRCGNVHFGPNHPTNSDHMAEQAVIAGLIMGVNMFKTIGIASLVTLCGTSAMAANRIITPSGQPDAIFQNVELTDAASRIANGCMDKGWQITSQSQNQIICEIPMSTMQSVLTQVLIGNSYSTTPRTFMRVTVAQVGLDSRAQAMAWTETQMAFGQIQQHPYTDDATFNNLEGFLIGVGGQLPPGTRIPGIFVGFDGQMESHGSDHWCRVTAVVPGSPGTEAGLKAGDYIEKVNGKAFKSLDDFTSKASKIEVGTRFPLLISRDGSEMTLMIEARGRPVIGPLTPIAQAGHPQTTNSSADVSAAAPTIEAPK